MMNTKKNTNRRGTGKVRRAVALLGAVMTVATTASICASADNTESVTFSFSNYSLSDNKKIDFNTAVGRLRIMGERKVKLKLMNEGTFKTKSSKLYGRRAIGVYKDGSYILSDWELIDDVRNDIMEKRELTITGDYVVLGYSYDVCRGTDFPYSGIFWDATDGKYQGTELNNAEIRISETAYDVSVSFCISCFMSADDFKDTHCFAWNCDHCEDHEEWVPKNVVINLHVAE